jgi:hypothetical protein
MTTFKGAAAVVFAVGVLLGLGAGTATATPGIYNYWGNLDQNAGVEGGRFAASGANAFGPNGVAVNDTSGEVYVPDRNNNRVQRFGEDGSFIAAWGQDVDIGGGTGYEICTAKASCKEGITSAATGGPLSFPEGIAINQTNGYVYVRDRGFNRIQVFDKDGAFIRAFGQDVVESGLGNTGTGFEICVAANGDVCKAGTNTGNLGGVISAGGGTLNVSNLTIAPPGTPNAGNLLLPDSSRRRVQEFTASGVFVRAFGWDVVETGPGNTVSGGFEVCVAANGDVCKAGVGQGNGVGQFPNGTPTRIAEAPNGDIYTVEPVGNFRVQRFKLPGNVVTPDGAFDPTELSGTGAIEPVIDNPTDVAVDDAGYLYVAKYFPEGAGTPPARVREQRILKVDPAANGGAGAVVETLLAMSEFEGFAALAVKPSGLPLYVTTSIKVADQPDRPVMLPRVVRIDEIPGLSATVEEAGDVKASTATLKATVHPAEIPLDTSYRFEYSEDGITWLRAPVPDFSLGNGFEGGESSSCSAAGPKAAICHVSQPISSLEPNVTYQVRIHVKTQFGGAELTASGPDFRTIPAVPNVSTGGAYWSSPPKTDPTLRLGGTVNPGHDHSLYYFQYVDAADYEAAATDPYAAGATAPLVPEEAGRGLVDVTVRQTVVGLDPSRTYHYRLVAVNSVGASPGADRTISPPAASDRFYEWVSNGDSWGAGVRAEVNAASADGDRAAFSAQAFGEPRSVPGPNSTFIAERGATGWAVTPMVPDPTRGNRGLAAEQTLAGGLGAALLTESSLGERRRYEARFGLAHIDGSLSPASAQLEPLAHNGSGGGEESLYSVMGASADLSSFAFISGAGVRLLADEPLPVSAHSNLYAISGAGGPSPALSVVNRADGVAGAVLGGGCGAGLGGSSRNPEQAIASHAISDDGAAIYFSARTDTPAGSCSTAKPKRLYKRVNNETTVEVSKSQCTRVSPPCAVTDGDDEYRGASADGSTVFFTSPRQLTDTDTDTTGDLYVYDETPPAGQPKLAQASFGEAVSGHLTPGSGAKALGVLDNSADGSRVYFVAEGSLSGENPRHKAPVSGQRNLYAYERDEAHPSGRIAFVGALISGLAADEAEWGFSLSGGKQASALPAEGPGGAAGDGHGLVFVTMAKLTAPDTDEAKDFYRYDDSAADPESEGLICVSCAGNGAFDVQVTLRKTDTGPGNYADDARVASNDLSTVVFSTQEALVGADQNATWDVYAWHDGALQLVSGGSEGFGIAPSFRQSAVSADGRDVFFITQAPLVGADTNNTYDVYDARIGGGSPEVGSSVLCVGEEQCRGVAARPPVPAPIASGTFAGPGNQSAPAPCKKGKVRKKGRCVKKPNRHEKHHKPAHANRGGQR